MTNAITLSFNDTPTRVIDRDGQPWFLGMDLINAMALEAPGRAYARLDADEKCLVPRTHLGMAPGRQLILISESGLYKLAMRSDKKSAKPFQDWVTKVVLQGIQNLDCSTAISCVTSMPS